MWWHGANWMFGWGWMPGFGLMSILFWVLLAALIVAIVRSSKQRPQGEAPRERSAGLDLLEQRYAKGEIQRDEFLQKKQDLQA